MWFGLQDFTCRLVTIYIPSISSFLASTSCLPTWEKGKKALFQRTRSLIKTSNVSTGPWTASLSSKETRSNSLVNWYYRRVRQSLRQFRVRKSILRIHQSTAIVSAFVVLTESSRSAVCRRRGCGCSSSERVELRVNDVVTVYKRWFSIRTKCMA